jgi:hypothetical protein
MKLVIVSGISTYIEVLSIMKGFFLIISALILVLSLTACVVGNMNGSGDHIPSDKPVKAEIDANTQTDTVNGENDVDPPIKIDNGENDGEPSVGTDVGGTDTARMRFGRRNFTLNTFIY